MPLLTLVDAQLAYGLTPLLDRASLVVDDGDRIGLIGRNGTGKSSLLGVLAGRVALEEGEVVRRDGLRIVAVEQEPALPAAATLIDALRLRAFPFSDGVAEFIARHDQVFVVEQNRDAQMRSLLVNELEIDPARLVKVLHYDGTPITARFITDAITAHVGSLQENVA